MNLCHFQLHHPDLVPRHVLLEEIVGREYLLEQVLLPLKERRPLIDRQHVLLMGPAGLGKTTLLWAIKYGIEADPELQAEWLPVVFPEEPNSIGDMADFWLLAIRQLAAGMGLVNDHADRLLEERGGNLTKKAKGLFFKMVDEVLGKKVVLLVDSFDQITRTLVHEQDALAFREHLTQRPELYVVATAPTYFKAISDMDSPFYDVFRVLHLDPFRRDLALLAFRKWANFYQSDRVHQILRDQPQRFHSLRILCGGNPRLLRLLFRVWHGGHTRDAGGDLERLFDDVGADYKHRIRRLKPLVRRTFDAIARHWNPVGVGLLTRQLRKPSNYVSAQIRRLVDEGYIEEVGGSEKRKTYQLVERFYNLFYLARYDRQGFHQVQDVMGFMDLFYRDASLVRGLPADRGESFDPERPRPMRFAFYNAFGAPMGDSSRRGLVARPYRDARAIERFQNMERALAKVPANLQQQLRDVAVDAEAAERLWPAIESLFGPHFSRDVAGWCDVILLLRQLDALPMAEHACRLSLKQHPADAKLWNWLGAVLEERGDCDQAMEAYQTANIHDGDFPLAHANQARLYAEIYGNLEQAEYEAEKALEKGDREPIYWFLLGNLYANFLGKLEEAEEAYGQAIDLRENFFSAWNNLGIALARMGQIENAEHAFRRALHHRAQAALPWNNLGVLCGEMMDREAYAEHAFHRAIDCEPKWALAYANLGLLYRGKLERQQQAEEQLMLAIEHAGENGLYYLDLASLLIGGGRRARAMEYVMMALKLSPKEPICREAFLAMAGENPYPWSEVLQPLLDGMQYMIPSRQLNDLRHFCLQGFFCLARAGRVDTVLDLLNHPAIAAIFRPLKEALNLKLGRISIDQLAPERLALIDEVRGAI